MSEPGNSSATGGFPDPSAGGSGSSGQTPTPGMTIGQILDRVFRLLRTHSMLYLGIEAVPAAAMVGMIVLMAGSTAVAVLPTIHNRHFEPDFRFFLWLAPLIFLLYIGVFLVYAVYAAASAFAVVRTNHGQAVTASQAWAAARERAGSFIWLMFLLVLIVAGPAYVAFGICGGSMALIAHGAEGSAPPPQFFLFIPLVLIVVIGGGVYMILMFLRYCLAFPASMMENLPAMQAIRRSVALTRGARGRIFLVLLVIYAATYVAMLVLEMLLFSLGAIGALAASALQLGLHSAVVLFLAAPLAILVALAVFLFIVAVPYAAYATALGVLDCDQKLRLAAAAALPGAGDSP